VSLRLNRRSESGLVPYVPPKGQDWRMVLRSRAWQMRKQGFWARQTGEHWGVRALDNPGPPAVSAALGVLTFGGLGAATVAALAIFRFLGIWA
jgi:hypothetical protein